jgi:CxxC motif-containing protein (DUF1111 family)
MLVGTALFFHEMALAQVDPGVRPGPAGAGGPLAGISADESAFFLGARDVFQEVDSVSGTIETGVGLGPRFNGNSCAMCHVFPDIGGTAAPDVNPQVAVSSLDGAQNVLPQFIHSPGPIREVRFINVPGTSRRDGGVHALFVISGRTDATNRTNVFGNVVSCGIVQDNFDQENARGNAIARIPTPVFGTGLIELTADSTLQVDSLQSSTLGVNPPLFNRSGNDGTITRFGWKAQNKSLLIFASEAYNVEQGVTNEGHPQEREEDPNCQFNALPEDTLNLQPRTPSTGSNAIDFGSDVTAFAGFMRFLAAPTPDTQTSSTINGHNLFSSIGCALCHVESHTTVPQPASPAVKVHRRLVPLAILERT